MNGFLLVVLLLLNGGISFWNAYACGSYWTESKQIGGAVRFLNWCGLTMAACGFTWCYLVIYGLIGAGLGKLNPQMLQGLFSLGYLVIILPVIGSGFGIWIHSLALAWRQRTFGNIAVASWNTFAQLNNCYSAIRGIPMAIKKVGDCFSGKAKGGYWLVILTILAAVAGIVTTYYIAMWADKKATTAA